MEKIIDKIDAALKSEFPGALTELELIDGKVWGYLVWKNFLDTSAVDRVCLVSASLRHFIGKDYRKKVSAIFPVTPWEIKLMREEHATPQNS